MERDFSLLWALLHSRAQSQRESCASSGLSVVRAALCDLKASLIWELGLSPNVPLAHCSKGWVGGETLRGGGVPKRKLFRF